MKSLRDYKLRLTETGAISHRITWGPSFATAIHGTINGMPARAIALGDLPGASTVLLCSDPSGFLTEVKATDFLTTDGAYLPLLEPVAPRSMPTTATPGAAPTAARRRRGHRARTSTPTA